MENPNPNPPAPNPMGNSNPAGPEKKYIQIFLAFVAILLVIFAWRTGKLKFKDRGEQTPTPTSTLREGKAEWGFFNISNRGDPLNGLSHVSWSRQTAILWRRLVLPDGTYKWSVADDEVIKAQGNGSHLILELKVGNDINFSDPVCYRAVLDEAAKGGPFADEIWAHSCPLKSEWEDDWKAHVKNVIERYDGDGINDMLGLTGNVVVEIQIENEPGSAYYWHWGENNGTIAAQSLLKVLRLSWEARNEADPGTRIIGASIINLDRLSRCGTPKETPGLNCQGEFTIRNRDFTLELLKYPQYFDAVDAHFFNYLKFDPYHIQDGLTWLKNEMDKNGYQKPIYSLEWTGSIMLPIVYEGHLEKFAQYFPYTNEFSDQKATMAMYENLSKPENAKYRMWFESEQAREFPKLFTTMLANGVRRMVHVQFRDFVGQGWDQVWWNWQGIVRYVGTEQNFVTIKKPSFYTYELLEDKLFGFTSIETLNLGNNIFAYKFTVNGKPIVVAWTEGIPTNINLSQFGVSGNVKVTHIITELDQQNNPIRPSTQNTSASAVPITDTPVFVQ